MNNAPKRGERLYIDLIDLESYFVVINKDRNKAIRQKESLSELEWLMFDEIADTYDSTRHMPCAYSYDELAKDYNASRNGIRDALGSLIEKNLIIKVEQGKGRAKNKYVPNVEYIHMLLMQYVKSRSVPV